jgi:hypothetical protein
VRLQMWRPFVSRESGTLGPSKGIIIRGHNRLSRYGSEPCGI